MPVPVTRSVVSVTITFSVIIIVAMTVFAVLVESSWGPGAVA